MAEGAGLEEQIIHFICLCHAAIFSDLPISNWIADTVSITHIFAKKSGVKSPAALGPQLPVG